MDLLGLPVNLVMQEKVEVLDLLVDLELEGLQALLEVVVKLELLGKLGLLDHADLEVKGDLQVQQVKLVV